MGYNALLHDLGSKVTGLNRSGLNMDSSLQDLFNVYAPSADHNDPEKYTDFVASWLNQVYQTDSIGRKTKLWELYAIARENNPSGVPAT